MFGKQKSVLASGRTNGGEQDRGRSKIAKALIAAYGKGQPESEKGRAETQPAEGGRARLAAALQATKAAQAPAFDAFQAGDGRG